MQYNHTASIAIYETACAMRTADGDGVGNVYNTAFRAHIKKRHRAGIANNYETPDCLLQDNVNLASLSGILERAEGEGKCSVALKDGVRNTGDERRRVSPTP